MTNSIPIVDLAKLIEVDNVQEDPEWLSVAAKVRESLGSIGFMYLVNHGIPDQVISNVFRQGQNFFALDTQVKLKYKKDTSVDSSSNGDGTSKIFSMDKYVGYSPPGGERLHPDAKLELKETYDWVYGCGVHPDAEVPQFKRSIEDLDVECKKLMKTKLLRLLAMSLGLKDIDHFVKCCRHLDDSNNFKGVYNIRILHYPPLEADDEAAKSEGSVRLGEHSDYGFLTLLFQDDTGGLEDVNAFSGKKCEWSEWLDAKPITGSILVNTGDLIEFWTCGIFPATPHRVVIPDNQNVRRKKSRYSVVFFNAPDIDTIVTPMMDLSKKPVELERLSKNGKLYTTEPINAYKYMMGRVAQQY